MSSKKDDHITVTKKEYIGSLKSFLYPSQISAIKKADKRARNLAKELDIDKQTRIEAKENVIRTMVKANLNICDGENCDHPPEPKTIAKIRSDMGYSDGTVDGDRTYALQIEPNTLMIKLVYLQGLEQL